ncbi:Dync2h1 [Symbiodinium natans]|uniref:Dync2h1 protein n=1 Tax=Symbiodinium natans TaxID=878477 RepID=A0A812V310_9DINO|nr:Dync2h1 [Symbiodinium natans]
MGFDELQVLCFDGAPDAAWSEGLHGLLDSTGAAGDPKLIGPTDHQPSFYIHHLPTTLTAKRVLDNWCARLPTLASWLPKQGRTEVARLMERFDAVCAMRPSSKDASRDFRSMEALYLASMLLRILETLLADPPQSRDKVMPGQLAAGRHLSTSLSMVMTAQSRKEMTGRFEAFAEMVTKANQPEAVAFDYVRYAGACYAFALTWSVAIGPNGIPLRELSRWCQANIPGFQLPKGCHKLTDVFVDGSSKDQETGYLNPWYSQLPVAMHEDQSKRAHYGDVAVPTVPGMSYSYLSYTLLLAGNNVFISGSPSVGKTMTVSSTEQSLAVLQKWDATSNVHLTILSFGVA